jgi:hypothetical protein
MDVSESSAHEETSVVGDECQEIVGGDNQLNACTDVATAMAEIFGTQHCGETIEVKVEEVVGMDFLGA